MNREVAVLLLVLAAFLGGRVLGFVRGFDEGVQKVCDIIEREILKKLKQQEREKYNK